MIKIVVPRMLNVARRENVSPRLTRPRGVVMRTMIAVTRRNVVMRPNVEQEKLKRKLQLCKMFYY